MSALTKRIVVIGVLLVSANLFAVQVEGSGDPWGVKGSSTVSNNYGYLGTNDYGVFGKDTSTGNYGYLGDHTYGAFGKHSSTKNLGYLGGILCGASGYNFTSRAIGYLGYGEYGVYGACNGNSGFLADSFYGVYGTHNSGNYGFLGNANAGACGRHSNGNWGEVGAAIAGVTGGSPSGNYGRLGTSSSGVLGWNSSGNYGHLATSEYGAYGRHSSGNYGYLGSAHYGTYGIHSGGNYGILGFSTFGVCGSHTSGNYGFLGCVSYGAYGRNHNGNYAYLGGSEYGLYAYGASTNSCAGYFLDASGAYAALATNTHAGFFLGQNMERVFLATTNIGILASGDEWAGYFADDVCIEGDLLVRGDKDNVIKLDNDTWVTMSATEAPYPEYTISGRTKLVNGSARVEFEEPYPQVISNQIPIKVIVTPEGSYSGIYVKDVTTRGFTAVSEAGDKNATFSWMAIARVKGREQKTDYNAVTAKMQRLEDAHREMGLSTQTLRVPANNEEADEQMIMQSQPELSLSVPEICASGSVDICFQLPQTSNVDVSVFDASGRLVRTLASERMNAGNHSIIWDGTDESNRSVSSGIYYARLENGTSTRTAKVTVIK